MHRRNQNRRLSRRGFTLVELMISVILMAIVVVAIYSFFTAMSSVFYTQEQIVDTQGSLRFALDFVSKDARRAGYLGTPDATSDPLICPKPAAAPVGVTYSAVRIINEDVQASVYGAGDTNGVVYPDTLYLMGSYVVGEPFPLDGLTTTGARLNGQQASRILGGGGDGENQDIFDAVFLQDRLVRITGPNNYSQLGYVSGSTWNPVQPQVTLTGLVGQTGNTGCGIQGLSGQNYEMSVLSIYRYQVRQSDTDTARSDLMRGEINPRNGALFEGSEISVLDYVVDFQAWVDMDTGLGSQPNMVRDLVPGDDIGNVTWSQTTNNWQSARVLYLSLSARTPREDPTLFHEPRLSNNGGNNGEIFQPLLSFNLDEDVEGAAHVITQSTSVELSNLTLRNLH